MKKHLAAIVVAVAAVAGVYSALPTQPAKAAAVNTAAVNFKVDPVHSHVVFKLDYQGVGTTWGMIKDPTGTMTLSSDSITLTLDLDINKIDSANAKRDEHLKGPDFFSASQFPKATFKSTGSKALANGDFEVTGDFTIRDVTKPVTVTLKKVGEKDTGRGYRAGFDTSFTINRLDYGVSYMPGALGNDVTIMVSFQGIRE
jgi:polyisoprenoid-binding protein YceI